MRNKLDARFAKASKELDRQEDQRFDQYVARKLRAWFTMFPPNSSPGSGGNDDPEEGAAAGGADGEDDADGDEEEAMALSGGEKILLSKSGASRAAGVYRQASKACSGQKV